MENTIQVMLIRHGETAENRERRYCGGGSDSLLSAEGEEQIRLNRKKGVYDAALQYPGRLFAVSSDLRRAVDTLDLILYGETGGEADSDCNAREGAFS
ncbi:MAG: histidine phosphatase family protein, partial [Eubacteriales bacterium]|nr:histidine phosphatase family protein [Eubacteriales bacterium]